MLKKYLIFSFLFLWCSLQGVQLCIPNEKSICELLRSPYRFGIGPEFYHVEVKRDQVPTLDGFKGHTPVQKGWMIGERTTFERILPFGIYYGADQYYAQGCVSTKIGCASAFTSNLTDAEIEGRLGYTFYNDCLLLFTFTPFFGWGDFHGTNRFVSPRQIRHIRFRPSFQYTTVGFLSIFYLCEGRTTFGVNVKWKFMYNAQNRIEDRAHCCGCSHHHHSECCDYLCYLQDMGNETLFQIDCPLTYHCSGCREQCFDFSIVPFFRNRIYGAKKNCPFDFFKTTYKMLGARLLLVYIF